MPVITNTPVQISGNPPDTSWGVPAAPTPNHVGPFTFGSDLYLILAAGPDDTLQAYKSSDGGVTWTLEDTGPLAVADLYFATDDSGTAIEIVYETSDAGNFVGYITFVPGSGFSIPLVSLGVPDQNLRACRFASGDFLVLYNTPGSSVVEFMRLSGGVWTSPATAFTGSAITIKVYGLVQDASGTGHFDYADSGTAYYRTIDSGDVVSSAVVIDAAGIGPMENWNDRLIIPTNDPSTGRPVILEGTPVSAPVWTKKFVSAATGSSAITAKIIALPIDGLTLGIFWGSSFATLLNFVTYDGTAFGAPVVYYDATNLPPPGGYDPADNFISGITVGLLSTGYGVALHLLYDDVNFFESFFYLLPTPGGPTISGTPPDGPVNVPYGPWTPTVTGGTPPYTYSIPTGSGTPPIGLTLDPATGTVSGTPTVVGTACFTVRVTDANSLHDDDPVCITITGGGYRNKVY